MKLSTTQQVQLDEYLKQESNRDWQRRNFHLLEVRRAELYKEDKFDEFEKLCKDYRFNNRISEEQYRKLNFLPE